MMKLFLRDRRGTTAIEYTLIASLISMAIIGGMNLWSDEVVELFGKIAQTFADAM